MCRVNTCCCCCGDVIKGAKYIAIFYIVWSIFSFITQANGFNPPNLVIAILLILVNILMFIGIQQSKAVLVLIWLIVMGFIGLLAIIAAVYFMVSIVSAGLGSLGVFLLIWTIVYFVFIGLTIYFWLVVLSAYLILKDAPPEHDDLENY